jgi:hypothetical protein
MQAPGPTSVSRRPTPRTLLACAAAILLASPSAQACDGKSYEFEIATGATVSGGGVTIRLDKVKYFEKDPDKYYISVKDDGQILADHMLLLQYDSLTFKTKCGTISIGATRHSMFSSAALKLNWSYF